MTRIIEGNHPSSQEAVTTTTTNGEIPLPQAASRINHMLMDDQIHRFFNFLGSYEHLVRRDPEGYYANGCDLTFGNPYTEPTKHFVQMLQRGLQPQSDQHFAYRTNDVPQRDALARRINTRYDGFDNNVDPQDVFLTTGNFAGLALSIRLLIEPGEKVVYLEPGFFCYRMIILEGDGKPVAVSMSLTGNETEDHAKDMEALLDTIRHDEQIKVLLLNQPHNPTGRVYGKTWLEELSSNLLDISRARGKPVYVLSDEAFSDFTFDGEVHTSIATLYPYTVLAYTYSKMTLAPSQRIGYLVLSPLMVGRETLRVPLLMLQISMSWCFPSATMMESLEGLEDMRDEFDVQPWMDKRDWMMTMLRKIGYGIANQSKGTFYILVQSPTRDDDDDDDETEFCRVLAEKYKVFVLPGSLMDTPGTFRVGITNTMETLKRSEEGFRLCFDEFFLKNAAPGRRHFPLK